MTTGASALAAPELAALLEQTGAPATARAPWLHAWASARTSWCPLVVSVHDGDRLVAAAPLATRRRGGLLQVVAAGHGESDEVRLPATPEAVTVLAEAVRQALRERSRFWVLRVEQLPVGDPVAAALGGLLPLAQTQPGDGLPRLSLLPGQPLHLSKNTRAAVNKARRRLSGEGRLLTETWVRDAAEVEAALPDLERVHRLRDLDARGSSQHDDPETLAAYRGVLLASAARGELEVLLLRVDGELAAFVVALRDGPVIRYWDNRVAPGWRDYSAGRVANTVALLHAAADPSVTEVDWMRGEETYKSSHSDRVDGTQHLLAWSGRLTAMPWAVRGVLARGRRRLQAARSGRAE